MIEQTPKLCACGCGTSTWRTWAAGHNRRQLAALEKAMEEKRHQDGTLALRDLVEAHL